MSRRTHHPDFPNMPYVAVKWLREFIRSECLLEPGACVSFDAFYGEYSLWHFEEKSCMPFSRRFVSMYLAKHGHDTTRRYWRGKQRTVILGLCFGY